MSSILQKFSPFTHFMPNEALLQRRRKLDVSLTAIYCSCLLAFAVYTGMDAYDPHNFKSTCYSTTLSSSTPITIKDLCYAADKKETAGGLTTFTCRGSHGAETWGVAKPSAKPNGGGGGNNNNGGGGGNNNNGGGGGNNNQCSGQASQTPCNAAANCKWDAGQAKCVDDNANQCNTPADKTNKNDCEAANCKWDAGQNTCKNNRRRLQTTCSLTQDTVIVLPSAQQQLCTMVISYPDAQLMPFNNGETAGVIEVNKDKKYCLPAADSTSNPSVVYPIKAYTAESLKNTEPVFTCCGQRMMTVQERLLEWLGGIGGFAGVLVGILSMFGPTSVENIPAPAQKKEIELAYEDKDKEGERRTERTSSVHV